MSEQHAIEQFKQAVMNNNVAEASKSLLDNPFLAERINESWFSFDTPAIVQAAASGNQEMVDLLLENGADLNAKSTWWAGGFGVLHHNHHELSHYLIERGAPVDIHAAAALGLLTTLQDMVEKNPAAVNERGPDGQAPLHFATDTAIIDFLLEHGAEIDLRDIDHYSSPSQWAIDDVEKCKYLIERGASADIYMAIQLGDPELVRNILLTEPDCLDARVGQGRFTSGDSEGGHIYLYKIGGDVTPLQLAARHKCTEIAELILEHRPPAHRLLYACLTGDQSEVQALLSQEPGLVQSLSTHDLSTITDAASSNDMDAVRVMLQAGFHADARRSAADFTALHNAAMRGNAEIVRLLLAHGASPQITHGFGGDALGSCMWGSVHFRSPAGDYLGVAEQLVRAGAPVPSQLSGSEEVNRMIEQAQT
ncbi:ankyrin repeat domain-containing protein [Paenibacillus sp. OV219]|uniref:ankyrin repeat domain-containing protein n=1 Tax=Paenibacillus sp. OV219 TaxID=1884377 RepID=UPI0008B8CAE4|nr:ankyrin repeat domain-containing protein [Paenibacillus sp. OV219]SEO00262.1 Ankyrin repeat-containing protein [Paenibacillus sp. OV219]